MPRNSIDDAKKSIEQTDAIFKNIFWLENYMRELKRSGASQAKIDGLNQRIIYLMKDLSEVFMQAKLAVLYASKDPARKQPNDTSGSEIALMAKHLNHLDVRYKNLQQRVLTRMHPLRTDPTEEILKDAPKVSNVDPFEVSRMQSIASTLFDDEGILKDKSVAKAMLPLSDDERKLFLNVLASHIFRNTPDHTQLNATRIVLQLPAIPFANEQKLFVGEVHKISKEISFEVLDKMEVEKHALPRSKDDTDKPSPPKIPPEKEKFEKQVKEIVDGFADKGGFAKFKAMLATLPSEQRLDLMAAVREENENRKLLKEFDKVNPKRP